MEPTGGELGPDSYSKGKVPVNAVAWLTLLRLGAAVGSGLLVVALFLDGPLAARLTLLRPFLGSAWLRALLFVAVSGVAALAASRENPRLFLVFAAASVLLVVPTTYPFSSLDWLGLFAGRSLVRESSSPSGATFLELASLALSLLCVLYLGWLRGFVVESGQRGVGQGELDSMMVLTLRVVGVFFGAAWGASLAMALLAGGLTERLTGLITALPLAVPALGLAASLGLAAALFLGLLQRSPKRR